MYYLVRCPYCSEYRITESTGKVKCFNCGHTFTVNPKNKPSRVIKASNNLDELRRIMFELRYYRQRI